MDAFFLTEFLKPKENFTDVFVDKKKLKTANTVRSVLTFIVGIYAVWLSWNCSKGDHVAMRVLYAAFAYLFGLVYLIYYALVRYNC
ncbi:hypothetical protein FK949_gp206 [Paramecium bursaria Chlorella virus NYs1]|uniref:Uncharacterized protein n=1 Tax=Paramecium bursaria Chlorella virus NYs1 TaxID=83442 RepID=M1I8T8_9PHYC|nr:hypothetical protein AR158_C755R [Paramecium bursaria Chlorella virus AR158]YP_009665564.1 hypothetical protein FK949_gp206 [Paramecium bursaria Chlorella virus NYs1]AGE54422.1 hypothetical protein PBCVIL52s1_887R [Paramecium bursaria Chlorella virus IL-5-2s1]AGE55102.1 hypothetical protein PBCVMA1D_862R [Paramecium bursaria Chlorella virus MA1D]ABU44300.1 hypothetical protein AR158_C755R [Paramecium bursaria Chlorella virus AR158]AGE58919.1 hypothetical protein PBCVNYs1_870R [Paramecium bu